MLLCRHGRHGEDGADLAMDCTVISSEACEKPRLSFDAIDVMCYIGSPDRPEDGRSLQLFPSQTTQATKVQICNKFGKPPGRVQLGWVAQVAPTRAEGTGVLEMLDCRRQYIGRGAQTLGDVGVCSGDSLFIIG